MAEQYLSTRQIMQRFSWTTRAMVSQIALRERWQRYPGSRPRLYLLSDIQDFSVAREHTDLARASGLIFRGIIRHKDGYSEDCPICKKTLDNH